MCQGMGGAHGCRAPVAPWAASNAWQEWRDQYLAFRNMTEILGSGSKQCVHMLSFFMEMRIWGRVSPT